MRTTSRTFLAIALVVLSAVVFTTAGFVLGANPSSRGALNRLLPSYITSAIPGNERSFPLQSEILDKLERRFYREVDPGALEESAVRGLLSGLEDPYTDYFDPEEYARFKERTEGTYSGVGMVVEARGTFVTVVTTFKDTPAEQGGLRTGDVVIEVDGESVEGLSLEQVVAKIKGPEGTEVMLGIYRPPAGAWGEAERGAVSELPPGGEVLELTFVRREIDVPVVEKELLEVDGVVVSHLVLFTFTENSSRKLRAAVHEAVEVDRAKAIVLDLRDNGGGLVDEAVGVASIFIPSGVIVSTEGLHSPRQVLEATGDAFADIPLYVLVNQFSASASEIVAGALKDYGRGLLIGETTFGKGLVQTIEALGAGGALKVTTAVYLTPNGTDINGLGVTPDIVAVDDLETEPDEALEKALELIGERGV
jgi:carboxyl-terminal processing protease